MPLLKCTKKNKYTNYFITGGPIPKGMQVRDELAGLVNHQYKDVKKILVAQEISEGDYHHFHIALAVHTEKRWPDLANKIIKLVKSWPDNDPNRKPNVGFFYAPRGTDGQVIMENYLTVPMKDKDVDADILDYDITLVSNIFTPPEDCSIGDINFIQWVVKTKKKTAPVFHRMSCKCDKCI